MNEELYWAVILLGLKQLNIAYDLIYAKKSFVIKTLRNLLNNILATGNILRYKLHVILVDYLTH